MATKRVFWLAQGTRQGYWLEPSTGFESLFELYQQNDGIVGAGHIGKHLIRLLQNFDCHVFTYDPFLSAEQARALGCEKLDTLDELGKGRFVACIDRCDVEPCALDHPTARCPTSFSPHIAGVAAENRFRIGTYAVNEAEAFLQGKNLIHEVTEASLASMA